MPRAPKHCGINGCLTIVPAGTRCPQHQTRWGKTASAKITNTTRWKKLRPTILNRDHHTCQLRYEGICTHHATEIDKIIPAAKRPDLAYNPTNLQAACHACNQHKARKHDR